MRCKKLDCGGVEKMMRRSGISLSETLVLTLLLGILASVIIPNISGVGPGSRPSTLARDLLKMRSQIECYKRHHNGQLPAGRGESFNSFLCRMARTTNADGDPGVEFGPYLRRLSVNPFNGCRTVRVDGAVAGTNIAGWRFDTRTGAFQADDSPAHARF